MKRLIILIIVLNTVANSFSENNKFSKWSFTAEYGFTFFYGDLAPVPPKIFPSSIHDLVYGFSAEYSFTPVWGLSADYFHLPISGRNTIAFFKTNFHNGDLNATINLTKLVLPAYNSKFNVNASLGFGIASFVSEYRYPDPVNSPIINVNDHKFIGSIPVAFSLEYDLTSRFSLGTRFHYRAYSNDNLEGVPYLNFKGVTNDYIAVVSLSARYKIGHKNRVHMRNISSNYYNSSASGSFSKDTCSSCETLNLVAEHSKSILLIEQNQTVLKQQLDSVLTLIANYSVDTDKDGVSDFVDRCPDTPLRVRGLVDKKGCPLDSDLDSIPDFLDNCPNIQGLKINNGCPEVKQEVKALFKQALQGIQFETNSADIKPVSLVILNKIVVILSQNPDYLIDIRGHTDNVGKPTANLLLSINRANAVLKFLTDNGLDVRRFTANGFGDTRPVAANTTTEGRTRNRRVEFIVSFER